MVGHELDARLRADQRKAGDFNRIHPLPQSGQDVPDDMDARLVVLGMEQPYSREPGNVAEKAAKAILESRGSAPRLFRNTLVFLAADQTRLQDLDEAVRRYLAWQWILAEKETLNLDPHQVKQAERQKDSTDGAVTARLPEAYQWLLVPVQSSPQAAIEWQSVRLSGQDALAVRACKKLRHDELLVTLLAGTRLKMELDRVPLWRGDHVAIKQLTEDFACYLYLPRLKEPEVLLGAIRDGLALLTWERESFAYAESYDEIAGRYRGLRAAQNVSLPDHDAPGLLVKPEVAHRQLDAETQKRPGTDTAGAAAGEAETESGTETSLGSGATGELPKPRRFHGSVTLDPTRVGRDASRIAEEVVAHLAGLTGAKVIVTLEIEATIPEGASEHVVRIVTENTRTLKFTSHGFETE